MSKIFIGTSGWAYSDWTEIFYPENLPSKDKLKYFSQHFKTAEINYSFYHLPRPSTYQNWYNQVPKDFIFSIKASRFITHVKRLKNAHQAWKAFLENALNLKEKLGPILFQFPPSFKATEENIKRLEEFLGAQWSSSRKAAPIAHLITMHPHNAPLRTLLQRRYSSFLRLAFEFRHPTWCDKKVYQLLRKYSAAWVIADSPRYPKAEVVTADFVYIRMHGSQILFGSKYNNKELKDLAQKIKKWLKQKLDVYVYFNNDFHGYAVENARQLIRKIPG